jgi:small-conductance mechanosensitive channel
VRIGTLEGTVQELGATAVRLVTPTSEEVTVPNTMLVADSIHNFSRPGADAVLHTTSVTIGYDAPWRQVQAMLLLAAARTPELLREPRPTVLKRALDDFYTTYELIAHAARGSSRAMVLSHLHGEILDVFNENGVQILSPHFVAQPAETVVVPKARWFTAPGDAGRGADAPDAAPSVESKRRD